MQLLHLTVFPLLISPVTPYKKLKGVVNKRYFVWQNWFESNSLLLCKRDALLLLFTLSTFLNDAVKQGYFVIQSVRNSGQPERAGSSPAMSLFACRSFIIWMFPGGVVNKRYFGKVFDTRGSNPQLLLYCYPLQKTKHVFIKIVQHSNWQDTSFGAKRLSR